MLGKFTDREVAEKLNRTLAGVRDRRKFLGKPAVGHAPQPFRMEREPRDRYARLFAAKSNQELRAILGWSVTNVAWRRKKLGIAAKVKPRLWSEEEEVLLGSKPDEELALMFGRTILAVGARRIQLGRPKPDVAFKVVKVIGGPVSRRDSGGTPNVKPGARYCTWTAEEDALLGTLTDKEVARRLGYPVTRVARRRKLLRVPSNNPNHRHWTKEEIALLGTRSDREVGLLVNRTLGNVRAKRFELGIPFCNPRYEIWKPDELALLGKLPDEEVARRTGHSLASVRNARNKRHILSPDISH